MIFFVKFSDYNGNWLENREKDSELNIKDLQGHNKNDDSRVMKYNSSLLFFCSAGSIHAASWNKNALGAEPDLQWEVGLVTPRPPRLAIVVSFVF